MALPVSFSQQYGLTLADPEKPPFLLTGVPRSGTSACLDALNEHPEIFCAFERFNWPLELAVYPFTFDDLFDTTLPDATFFSATQSLANRKSTITTFGNKKPRYYLTLHHLLCRQPARIIFLHRPPAHTAASWSVRAFNTEDTGWERGMPGIYAFLDYIQMMHTLCTLPPETEYVVVDYNALLFDEGKNDVLRGLFHFLGVPNDEAVQRSFTARQDAAISRLKGKERKLRSFEKDFHDTYGMDGLEDLFRTRKLLGAKELFSHVEAFLTRLSHTDFLDAFFDSLSGYDHAPAIDYCSDYITDLYANAGAHSIFQAFGNCIRHEPYREIVDIAHGFCDNHKPPSPLAVQLLPHAQALATRAPSSPGPYAYLGDLLACIKRTEEAIVAYQKALSLMSRDHRGRAHVARQLKAMQQDRGNQ